MEGLPQTSHGGHKTESIKPPSSEGTVLKESRIKFFDDLLVPDDILENLSLLNNEEFQALEKILKVPKGSQPKMHTDYGAQQRETTYKMLLDWKKEMGNKATYGVLVEALVAAGRADLANITSDLIHIDEYQLERWIIQIERKLLDLEEEILVTERKTAQSKSHDLENQILIKERNLGQSESLGEHLHLKMRKLELEQELLEYDFTMMKIRAERQLLESQLEMMKTVHRPNDRKLLDLIRKNLIKKEQTRFQSGLHEERHYFKMMKVRTERQLLDIEEEDLRTETELFHSNEHDLKIAMVHCRRHLLDLEEENLTMESKHLYSELHGPQPNQDGRNQAMAANLTITEEEDEIVNLAHLFESMDRVSEIQPVLSEILSKEMYVDARGGRLVIEEADLMLDFPTGALSEGVNIRVAVVNDNGVMFPGDDTPMVTPIVKCKPTGLTFQTPVTLVLPHCGILTPNKDHRAISMQGYTSGGCLQWNIDENSQTTISKRRCSIELSHFCYRSCSITGLQHKRMRVFILKKKTECAVLVKLWICNDNQSVFNNIVNEEQDDGYQKMGSHEEFALSIKKGDIQIKCSGIDMMISLEDIWNVSRRSTFFQIPIENNIGVILLVKQIEQDEAYSLCFFIDDKTPCKRRKRKHPSTDSAIHEQQCLLISESRNSESSSSECVTTTPGRNEMKDFNENNLVSRSSLENLSGLVGKNWLELGRRLDLHDEKLQNIARDHAGNEKEIIYQMLLNWHSRNGHHATYHHLFAALRAADRRDLIEDSTLSEKWVNT